MKPSLLWAAASSLVPSHPARANRCHPTQFADFHCSHKHHIVSIGIGPIMSPDCPCGRCSHLHSRGKDPIHLKRYDDTTSTSTPQQTTLSVTDTLLKTQPGTTSLPRCECERCASSRASGRIPQHLKRVDDTITEKSRCTCPSNCSITACAYECNCEVCDATGFESAYLNFWGPEIIKGGLDYDECSPKELKRFIEDRGLRDPYLRGLTLRSCYIPTLNAADRAVSFDFLNPNFPAELRIMVYGFLLRPYARSSGQKCCHPQISATCRQIHQEAQPELYKLNTAVCSFSADMRQFGSQYRVSIHGKESVLSMSIGQDILKLIQACELPIDSSIKKFATLKVKIHLDNFDPDIVSDGTLQNCLLVFASSLMDGPDLKNVTLRFESTQDGYRFVETELAENVLYPLRRLRNAREVKVSVCLTYELAAPIKNDMQGNRPTFNTWKLVGDTLAACNLRLGFIREHNLDEISENVETFVNLWASVQELETFNEEPWLFLFEEEGSETAMRQKLENLVEIMPSMADLQSLQDKFEAECGIGS